jgi:hypothetical protein
MHGCAMTACADLRLIDASWTDLSSGWQYIHSNKNPLLNNAEAAFTFV